MSRLDIDVLDGSALEHAGALLAREQAAARRTCPRLPESHTDARVCTEALQQLLDAGGLGVVARVRGRPVAVMTAIARNAGSVGRYARLPAEGLAVDPDLDDPTTVLAPMYAQLAAPLVADGVRRFYLLHVARPRLPEGLSDIGFGRHGVYGVQAVAQRPACREIGIRIAGPSDLDTVAGLALVELRHRATPPMFGPDDNRPQAEVLAEHRALHEAGAVHLLATLDGREVGLLTIEPASAAPRICPAGQPYIGPTATHPDARRRGVGRALVDAALNWAHRRGHRWLSVDFEAANPQSRPFWLAAGFHPTGYGLLRFVDPLHATPGR
jgi:GNAT superfamily N-acetyltransferase